MRSSASTSASTARRTEASAMYALYGPPSGRCRWPHEHGLGDDPHNQPLGLGLGWRRRAHVGRVDLVQESLLRVVGDVDAAADLDPAALRRVEYQQAHPRFTSHVARLHAPLD